MAASITTKGRFPKNEELVTPLNAINADEDTIVVAHPDSLRARIVAWKELRFTEPGLTQAEIAIRLGISPSCLKQSLQRAVKEGILRFEDPIDRIDHELAPLVMDNLKSFLTAKDKQVTLEVAKGTIYKTYEKAKGLQSEAPTTMLALKIEATPPSEVRAISGVIVGQARGLEDKVDN